MVDVPDPATKPEVTPIVATVVLSEVFLMVILPLSASTASEKFNTMFAFTATLVALSAGVEDESVGAVES